MTDQTPYDDGLWDFLRKRGVTEENINRMQEKKIDTSVIRELEDSSLACYIPLYGDKIATKRYCLDKQKQKDCSSSKMSLLDKLRKKMKTGLDCAAEGTDMRVPCLSPKWQEEEWKAIGRILAKGFMDKGYFPLRLAPAYTVALVFGEHSVSSEMLFESLLLYLGHCERDLLATALKEDLDSDGQDELLDLLDRMGVKTVPSRENFKGVLLQVAHKQLIQTPKYVLDNMAAVAGKHQRTELTTPEKIQCMYADKKPTCRKVLKLIDARPVTPADRQALGFLQQYIRGLDEMGLRRLLRFVTGSDALEGLAPRSVAHTCGPLFELPSTYYSYPELRVEMENVLTSNYYTMDIV